MYLFSVLPDFNCTDLFRPSFKNIIEMRLIAKSFRMNSNYMYWLSCIYKYVFINSIMFIVRRQLPRFVYKALGMFAFLNRKLSQYHDFQSSFIFVSSIALDNDVIFCGLIVVYYEEVAFKNPSCHSVAYGVHSMRLAWSFKGKAHKLLTLSHLIKLLK